MRIEPLGDTAFILRHLTRHPAIVAKAIEQAAIAGVVDVVPCVETVGVYFTTPVDPTLLRAAALLEVELRASKTLEIPICYELGEDLDGVVERLSLTKAKFIELHTATPFDCFAIGFCPGFAYLGPLPEALRDIPRLPSPRRRTEPGSVGITGNQTAVYPLVRPGGWPIVGKTPLTLVDVAGDYFPISVGDKARFVPISPSEFGALQGRRL